MLKIPIQRTIDDAAEFDLQINLEGTTYTLDFHWNVRLEAWFMSVWDAEHLVPYQVGTRMVADWWMNRNTADRRPAGAFILIDTAAPVGQGEEPGFDDLGNRHLLHYATLAELTSG